MTEVLDKITDESVSRMVKQIVYHYQTNIANRFIRPVLLQIPFDDVLWNQIESITERSDQLGYNGYSIDELYRHITALSKFVLAVRREVAPTLKYRIGNNYMDKMDKVLRDMAISNFSSNLQAFAQLIYELYSRLVEIDMAAAKGKSPVYKQYEDLLDIQERLMAVS
jgi:citrate synthase